MADRSISGLATRAVLQLDVLGPSCRLRTLNIIKSGQNNTNVSVEVLLFCRGVRKAEAVFTAQPAICFLASMLSKFNSQYAVERHDNS